MLVAIGPKLAECDQLWLKLTSQCVGDATRDDSGTLDLAPVERDATWYFGTLRGSVLAPMRPPRLPMRMSQM